MNLVANSSSIYPYLIYSSQKTDRLVATAYVSKVCRIIARRDTDSRIGNYFHISKCYRVVGLAIYKPCVILAHRDTGT
jgi:hypothetical protein